MLEKAVEVAHFVVRQIAEILLLHRCNLSTLLVACVVPSGQLDGLDEEHSLEHLPVLLRIGAILGVERD